MSGIEQILTEAAKSYNSLEHIQPIHALGTQALRMASNAQKLVQMLKNRFDLTLEIISSDEEAELEKIAICHTKARFAHPNSRILTLDSGGSSTEYNLLETDDTTIARDSYPFGQHDISKAMAQNLDMPFEDMMHELEKLCHTHEPGLIIAAGSSITTYAGYALKIGLYSPDEIESQRIFSGAEVPRSDDAANAGKRLTEALEQRLKLPVFVTTFGIRHGWLAKHHAVIGM